MKQFRPYRFPPLAQFTTQRAAAAAAQGHGHGHGGDGGAQWAASVSEGFEQGQRDGYEIGLARGRKLHDKRSAIREREVRREMDKAVRAGRRGQW